MTLTYQLTYAGIPLVGDRACSARPKQVLKEVPVDLHKWSPEQDLLQEIDRILPFLYLQDIEQPPDTPGKNVSDLARRLWGGPHPSRNVRVGDYYYPTGMSRYSVFRGLATTSMVAKMLAATQGNTAQPFIMKVNPNQTDSAYTISTNLFLLPPRILGETTNSSGFDGLFLVTLVDERYNFLQQKVGLTVTGTTKWADLLTTLASFLGITLTYSTISPVYGQPEPDSQLWNSGEPACALLDAVAYNVGRVVVRNLNGTYSLQTPMEAKAVVLANRGPVADLTRIAGGDNLQSGRSTILQGANAVLPANVVVSFPQYLWWDPIPHYHNPRFLNSRWVEDSPGGTFQVTVPIASAGLTISGGWGISGMMGFSGQVNLSDRCKAHYSGYSDGNWPSTPLNTSGLTALSMQMAQDFCYQKIAANLDEAYPGTLLWSPEGLHDIVWTYRESSRLACCRVLRRNWQDSILQFQHALPAQASGGILPAGIGGKSVCQTHYDTYTGPKGGQVNQLATALHSGDPSAQFQTVDYLPTGYRWKGQVDQEVILFEGTSGGTGVNIVQRGMDGTIQAAHQGAAFVQYVRSMAHGVNAVKRDKGTFTYIDTFSSGGVFGAILPAEIQTLRVFSASGRTMAGNVYYSGQLFLGDPSYTSPNGPLYSQEMVWAVLRTSGASLASGAFYAGQFIGFSPTLAGSVPPAPVYLIDGRVPQSPVSGFQSGGTGAITDVTLELDDASVVINNLNVAKLHVPPFGLVNFGNGGGLITPKWGPNIQPVGQVSQPGNSQLFTDSTHVHASTIPIWNIQNIFNISPYEPIEIFNEYYQSWSFWDLNTWWCIPAIPCASGIASSGALAPCPPVIPYYNGWISNAQGEGAITLALNWQQTVGALGFAIISYYSGTPYTVTGWTLTDTYNPGAGCMTVDIWTRQLDGTETGFVFFNPQAPVMGFMFAVRGASLPEAISHNNQQGPNATAIGVASLGANRIVVGIFSEYLWAATTMPQGMTGLMAFSQQAVGLGFGGMAIGWQAVGMGQTGNYNAIGGGPGCIVSELMCIPVQCYPTSGFVSSGAGSGVTSGGGGGGTPVQDSCCNTFNNTLTLLLYGGVTGPGAACSCWPATTTVTLTWDGHAWNGTGANGCVGGEGSVNYRLFCNNGFAGALGYILNCTYTATGGIIPLGSTGNCAVELDFTGIPVSNSCKYNNAKVTN